MYIWLYVCSLVYSTDCKTLNYYEARKYVLILKIEFFDYLLYLTLPKDIMQENLRCEFTNMIFVGYEIFLLWESPNLSCRQNISNIHKTCAPSGDSIFRAEVNGFNHHIL